MRSNARLGHRGSLVVPWTVVVSPCPSGAQQAKGWLEMAQMGQFHRWERSFSMGSISEWPEEINGDAP